MEQTIQKSYTNIDEANIEAKQIVDKKNALLGRLYEYYALYIQAVRYHIDPLGLMMLEKCQILTKMKAMRIAERFLLMDFETNHTASYSTSKALMTEINARLKSEFSTIFEDTDYIRKLVIE